MNVTVDRLRAIFDSCQDLFVDGASRPQIEERIACHKGSSQYFIRRALAWGWIFTNHNRRYTRYFLTAEAVEVWRKTWDVERYELRKARVRRRYWRLREKIVAAPVSCLPKGERKPDSPATKFKRASAYVPPHVKTQVCPCGKDTRFTVSADFIGPFGQMGPGKYFEEHAA